MNDAEKEFLRGLTKLTKKTGIAIDGCGCCGSPFLTKVKSVKGEYTYSSVNGEASVDDIKWKSNTD